MQENRNRRRSYGTGSLERRRNADGSQSWVAVWREHGRKRKETLGRVREGRFDGLSEKQAEIAMAEVARRADRRPTRGGRVADDSASRRALPGSRRAPRAQTLDPREHRVGGTDPPNPVLRRAAIREDRARGCRGSDLDAVGQGARGQDDPQHHRDAVGAVQLRQSARAALGVGQPVRRGRAAASARAARNALPATERGRQPDRARARWHVPGAGSCAVAGRLADGPAPV